MKEYVYGEVNGKSESSVTIFLLSYFTINLVVDPKNRPNELLVVLQAKKLT